LVIKKKKIGTGKSGVVRFTTNIQNKEIYAVKILTKKIMTVSELDQIYNEIEIMKVCKHPNIIKLIDNFEDNENIYIVTELLKGGDLFGYLDQRNFNIPEIQANNIVRNIAAAISYMQKYGIVHRDLKPENILLTENSENMKLKVADFGVAKIMGPNETCKVTIGTLGYIAPEVLCLKSYDKSVDIWSLGIISYLLLCGSLPFDSDDDKETAR